MAALAAVSLPSRGPLTLETWAQLEQEEPGELVDGWLVGEEVPTHQHEVVVSWLIWFLTSWARPRGGWVFGSEHKVAVAPDRGRKPDVAVYEADASLRRRDALSRTPPALVVEVLSPRPRDVRRDRLEKLREYARFGVRWYWLVDPEARLLEVFELGADGRYVIACTAAEGTVSTLGLEGLVLDLDELWAEVARLPEGGGEDQADESGEY